jgi:hypothetical protein
MEMRNGIGDQEDKTWKDLEKTALDRRAWKDVAVDLCLQAAKWGRRSLPYILLVCAVYLHESSTYSTLIIRKLNLGEKQLRIYVYNNELFNRCN